jgi:CheY-like chemotaxis protein
MIGVAAALAATAVSAQQPAGERKSRVAETYASRYNVSYEEALRRLKFQTQVGELDARLTEQERATFGGLYIEHKPTFRVVVKFTGADGATTLAKYTQDPAYIPVVAETAYSALLDIQSSLAVTLKPLNIKAWTDIDVKAGRVKLYVPDPTVINAATLAGTVKLSPLVDVVKAVSPSEEREATIEGGRSGGKSGRTTDPSHRRPSAVMLNLFQHPVLRLPGG